ncbi:MAG: DNA recombination/repair protein RecA, partial [Oscillospiraceae bacterium]
WFSYGETRLGQGRDNVKELLANDEVLRNSIEAEIKANQAELAEKLKAGFIAKNESIPEIPETAAKAKAKLDIAVDDDE